GWSTRRDRPASRTAAHNHRGQERPNCNSKSLCGATPRIFHVLPRLTRWDPFPAMQFSPHGALRASLPPRSASPKPLAGTVPCVFPFPAQDHLPRISSACSARHPACVPSLQTCPCCFPLSRTASSELAKQFRYYRNALSGSQGGRLPVSYHWQQRIDRWKNATRGFFRGGRDNQPRPRLCPACGTLVGISATRCHECGANLRFSLAALSKRLSGLFGEFDAPVTTALLIANLLMFGVSWIATTGQGEGGGLRILWGMGGEASYRLGASFPYSIYIRHEWYRLITAMFLHGGLIHIGFNMMSLMQLGPALEELYGSARYFFLYVVTGAFGFLISAAFGNYSLGASGALLGLVGAMLAVTTKRGGSFMRELRSRLISSVVILFMLGFAGMGLDNTAHFAGLASGFVIGKLFTDRQPMNV